MSSEDPLFLRYGRVVPAGTVIFREGDPGPEMFVIQSGQVRISRQVRDVEKLLAMLGPGEFFGEMSIIQNLPRTGTAVAVTDARLLVLDAKTFEQMVRSNVEIAVRLIKKFAERLAEADAQIENLLFPDASSRVVHHLVRMAESRGIPTPEGVRVEVDVETLPAVLGVRPDQVQDVLTKMGRARICMEMGGYFLVPRMEQLLDFLDFLEKRDRYAELG